MNIRTAWMPSDPDALESDLHKIVKDRKSTYNDLVEVLDKFVCG